MAGETTAENARRVNANCRWGNCPPNLHRRHLTTSQRASVAAKMAALKHGGDRKPDEIKVHFCNLNEARDKFVS
jgi:hypothetical protein